MDAPPGYDEPTFGSRLLARLLDGLVLLLPIAALGALFDRTPARLLTLVVVAAYEVTLTARDGQTIGKRVLGLRVVDHETGDVIGIQQAFLRWLTVGGLGGLVAAILSPALGGLYDLIVLAPILQPPLHRGLHDRAAGTIVTRVH